MSKLAAFILIVPFTAGADALDALARSMQGRFDTHAPGRETNLPIDQRLVDSRQRADAPAIGEVVFYLQLNQGADLRLYRQRLLVFAIEGESIVQRAYVLNDPARFVDARSGDAVLSDIAADDIRPMFERGCGQVWTTTESGFRGYTDPGTCRIVSSRTGKPRRIEAEAVLTTDELLLVERGYDDEMNQLFGTPQGDSTVLHRIE